jgi:hypothetical protein
MPRLEFNWRKLAVPDDGPATDVNHHGKFGLVKFGDQISEEPACPRDEEVGVGWLSPVAEPQT